MTLIISCQPPSQYPPQKSQTELIANHFEQIKQDPEALRQFFWKMPKGGDLHHHALGSVWAEDYLQLALEKNLWINSQTYQLYFDQTDALSKKQTNAIALNDLIKAQPRAKENIIDHWSVRNHREKGRDGHHWFFATFEKFEPAMIGNESYFLSKLCEAAAAENIQYLETMVAVPSIVQRVSGLVKDKNWEPGISLQAHLNDWFEHLESQGIDQWADYNAEVMEHWMSKTEKHGVRLKFQTVGLRILPDPAMVFAHLMLAFKTAMLTDELVGVNFVAPEDHNVALENYNTHMAMFRFLREKYPEVNLSLHAGELVPDKGDVQDKDLTYHIDHAITVAGAQRIGHGVDLNLEDRKKEILTLMKEKRIAVEINLESNEVILETSPSSHPIRHYLEAGVPVCISSDDAAILRTDLTHQYEILIDYLPEVTYTQVKDMVFNSIEYSFLNEEDNAETMTGLKQAFSRFEENLAKQLELK